FLHAVGRSGFVCGFGAGRDCGSGDRGNFAQRRSGFDGGDDYWRADPGGGSDAGHLLRGSEQFVGANCGRGSGPGFHRVAKRGGDGVGAIGKKGRTVAKAELKRRRSWEHLLLFWSDPSLFLIENSKSKIAKSEVSSGRPNGPTGISSALFYSLLILPC